MLMEQKQNHQTQLILQEVNEDNLPQHTPQRAELSLQREAGGKIFLTG